MKVRHAYKPSWEFSFSLLPFSRSLPFIRLPNSFIVVRQQLIFWLILLLSLSMLLIGCLLFTDTKFYKETTRIPYGHRRGMRTKQFEELLCFPAFSGGLRQQSIYFTRNLPSIRSLNSCIFFRQHLICELVLLHILSKLFMDVFVHERWILGQWREGLISRPAWTVMHYVECLYRRWQS